VPAEASARVLPTALAFAVRLTVAALRERGVAAEPILARAGLTEPVLDDRQTRISAAAQCKCLEFAAEALGDEAFGLRLAEASNPREAGALFYVANAASTLLEASRLYTRYFRLSNEAIRPRLSRAEGAPVLEFSCHGPPRLQASQYVEFHVALLLKAMRDATGTRVRPVEVAFAHRRTADLEEFNRFFGCPVEFGAPSDSVTLSDEVMALRLTTGDPYLFETLRPFCEAAALGRNTGRGAVRARVENEVERLLPHGRAQKPAVARSLAMSPRTLARRLATEGTSYEAVVDRMRHSLAMEYLREPDLSLSQIAWLLGYEDSTSLSHAFRRWAGQSPSAARRAPPPSPAR